MPVQPIEKINRRVPLVVVFGVILLLAAEAIWLLGAYRANRNLERANLMVSETTRRMKARTADLKANEDRIKALYTRLNDAIIKRAPARGVSRLPAPGKNQAQPSNLSPIVKTFTSSGCEVVPSANTDGDLSVRFAIGSDKLEFHRLLPLLTEEENSNAFLVVDSLTLTRPEETPPFSLKPAALESRLTVHLLAMP
jgi:hypothetical protein